MNVTDGEHIYIPPASQPLTPRRRSRIWWLLVPAAVVVIWVVNWFTDVSNVSMNVSPDGLVVFSARGKGGNDLYLLDLKTKTVKPFVISPEYEDEPAFSPDGKSVVYSVSKKPLSGGHIYVKSLDGHQMTQLTHDKGVDDFQPAFSSDGSKVVFMRANRLRDYGMGGKTWDQNDLFVVDVKTTKSVRLLDLRQHYQVCDPCFAADGCSVLYTAVEVEETNIMALYLPSSGCSPTKLAQGSDSSYSHITNQIVFISDRTTEYQYEIWMMNSDGTGQRQITHTKPSTLLVSVANSNPTFSGDGKRIYYLHEPRMNADDELWEIGVDGSNAKRIADSGLFKHPLRWKP